MFRGNKRILITGGAGTVGSELTRQLYKRNKLYLLDINEMGLHELKTDLGVPVRVGDIRNRETVKDVIDDFRPQVVFHAAAYKSVDMMEYSPREATSTNVDGTANVLDYAKIYSTERFIFLSTDKVVNAASVMGQTKKLGETMTVNSGKGFIAVRFGNIMGSRGSLIEIWERQINQGKPITVTDDRMKRYFMTKEEAVNLVIEAAKIGEGGEVICFDIGKPVNIRQLAEELVKKLGRDIPIENIGNRGGEVLEERLMTIEVERRVIKKGKFLIIPK